MLCRLLARLALFPVRQSFALIRLPRLLPSACACALQALRLGLTAPGPGILRVRLTDPRSPRWEVPTWLFRSPLLNGQGGSGTRLVPATASSGGGAGGGSSSKGRLWQAGDIQVELRQEPFSLEVSRVATPGQTDSVAGSSRALFNTTSTRLAYKASTAGLSTLPALARPPSQGRLPALQPGRVPLAASVRPDRPSVLAVFVPAGSVPGAIHLAGPLGCAVRGRRARLQDAAPRVSTAHAHRAGGPKPCPGVGHTEGLCLSTRRAADPVSAPQRTGFSRASLPSLIPPCRALVQAQRHAAADLEPRPGAHLPGAEHVWQPPGGAGAGERCGAWGRGRRSCGADARWRPSAGARRPAQRWPLACSPQPAWMRSQGLPAFIPARPSSLQMGRPGACCCSAVMPWTLCPPPTSSGSREGRLHAWKHGGSAAQAAEVCGSWEHSLLVAHQGAWVSGQPDSAASVNPEPNLRGVHALPPLPAHAAGV